MASLPSFNPHTLARGEDLQLIMDSLQNYFSLPDTNGPALGQLVLPSYPLGIGAPSSPLEGQMWFETGFFAGNGQLWISTGGVTNPLIHMRQRVVSPTSGAAFSSSGSFTDVANLSINFTPLGSSGRLHIYLQAAYNSGGTCQLGISSTAVGTGTYFANFRAVANGQNLDIIQLEFEATNTTYTNPWILGGGPGQLVWDYGSGIGAGTYVVKLQAQAAANTQWVAEYCQLVVEEWSE